MNEHQIADIKKYAKLFSDKKFIECGYIAVRNGDGILITETKADFQNLEEKNVVYVNDKNIDSFEGNFRAAAVILFCAIRQDGKAEAAAIVDSDAILKYSSKRKALMPILDEVAQLCGITVKCASKNVAAEIVTSLSGMRNACLMPDAGAVVKARSLQEVFEAVAALDKACSAQLIADSNGLDTYRISSPVALVEQCLYKMKTAKSFKKALQSTDKSAKQDSANVPSAQPNAVAPDGQTANDENANTQNSDTAKSSDNIGDGATKEENIEFGKVTEFALFKDEEQEEVALLVHPFYGSILSAIGKSMPVPNEFTEELGREIPCAASAMTCTKKAVKNVCAVIGEAPACFIAGHGVVVRGTDRDDALSVCETLEKACKLHLEVK